MLDIIYIYIYSKDCHLNLCVSVCIHVKSLGVCTTSPGGGSSKSPGFQ